ncbi:YfaZ family outer membrane protein [Klebsiella pneumoniae]|uniref:YfaZ family outer membrane protein n=1 Tax=Klebsiella pneumoniae TaxID=573 RepID=UPI001F4E361F|nr:YfaZ family outer membrane protein [Klebsiella pneumoniae]MCH9494478.1 YfaZ family protein [Klebsiella pneumoniae]MCH9505506.1 YfaZ family protein [Klebsiella pneumoniae]MCH9526751.1 YfaZ family protein [Klebsiella pneumoniae]
MKSIAAKMVAVTIALGASSAACAAVNLHGEAGAEFTNLSASFGAGEPGMTFSSQWAHSDNDGDSVGLGMGYNFNVGPFLMNLGGKAVYLDGDEGYAIAAGGGAELPLGQYFTFFGEGYYSPDSMSSGVEDYVEANAGVRLNVLPSLNIEAGYRYIDMAGKDGNRDNTLADGAYAGVNFRF